MEPAQEVRKEEAALPHKATHSPECYPSQFTWVVCGGEQSTHLFSSIFEFMKEITHVHMMCRLYDIQ